MALSVKAKLPEVSLNNIPNRPEKSKAYDVDPNAADKLISAYDSEYQGPISEIVARVRRISFDEFCRGLRTSIESLPRPIKDRASPGSKDKVAILVSERKSNQWVAEIAKNMFQFTGSYLPLGQDNARDYVEKVLTPVDPRKWPQEVVLFDDASYSGTQITGHATAIADAMIQRGGKGRISIVVPFMTRVAEAKLDALRQRISAHNVDLVVADHGRIQTVRELSSEENYPKLAEIFSGQLEGDEDTGIAATYLDHKVPNGSSFLFYGLGLTPPIKPPYLTNERGTGSY